jgi:glycosyltransferase involved in cell wall biosynthesis
MAASSMSDQITVPDTSAHRAGAQACDRRDSAGCRQADALSFVIPVYNERQSLQALHERIVSNAIAVAHQYEIIFVDDGSSDGSREVIRELCTRDPNTRLIALGANCGKATALDLGFRHARSPIVFTLDADLQDDPDEISRFVDKIGQGYDLVSGWKAVRHDPWHKRIPSKVFNWVVRMTTGVPLHDFNCGFKAYTRKTIEHLSLYGEQHRYIPVIAHNAGNRVTEITVRHHPRQYGRSKYGLLRLPKGFLDLVTVLVTSRYLKRPLHFFGSIGLMGMLVGGGALLYLAILWVMGHGPIGNRPLLMYGMLLAMGGLQLFSLGVVAELMIKLGHRGELPPISETMGFDSPGAKGGGSPST